MPDGAGREVPVALVSPQFVDDSLEELYEHAPCGYLSSLPDGRIVKVNQTLLRWIGRHRDEVVGRRIHELFSPGSRIFYETHYAPLLEMQGAVDEIAVEFVCGDGERLPTLTNSVMKTDVVGRPMLVRTAVFRAAERRGYERELLLARQRAEESEARVRVLAQTLQASLIPPAPPQIPGLDVAAVYRPAGTGDEVGGDFYDVFATARDDWAVVVGDVCGKGAGAAAVTALARYTVRAAAMRIRRPSTVLATLNEALLREEGERFCTAVYGRVRQPEAGRFRLTVAAGGHPLPIIVDTGSEPRSFGRAGSLLGVLDDVSLHDVAIDLQPGSVVALFTDGVTEGRGEAGFFGEDRLRAVLAAHRGDDASTISERLVEEVVAFQDGLPRDDIAVVVLRVP